MSSIAEADDRPPKGRRTSPPSEGKPRERAWGGDVADGLGVCEWRGVSPRWGLYSLGARHSRGWRRLTTDLHPVGVPISPHRGLGWGGADPRLKPRAGLIRAGGPDARRARERG